MLGKEASVTNEKLRLFSLYDDLPAAAHARGMAGVIAKLAGPHWRTTSEMWKIDSLQISEPIREMISNDAVNADVIILAASSLSQSGPMLIRWLRCPDTRRNSHPYPGLLIGLLGNDETTTADLDLVVKPLMDFAQLANRVVLWHRTEPGAMDGSDWLTDSVGKLLANKLWFEVLGAAFRKSAMASNTNNLAEISAAIQQLDDRTPLTG